MKKIRLALSFLLFAGVPFFTFFPVILLAGCVCGVDDIALYSAGAFAVMAFGMASAYFLKRYAVFLPAAVALSVIAAVACGTLDGRLWYVTALYGLCVLLSRRFFTYAADYAKIGENLRIGLAIYMVMTPLMLLVYPEQMAVMAVGCALFVVSSIVAVNRSRLYQESHQEDKRTIPKRVMRNNIILVGVLLAVIALSVLARELYDGIIWLAGKIMEGIYWVILAIGDFFNRLIGPAVGEPNGPGFPTDASPPADAPLLDTIALIFGILLVIAITLVLLYGLYRLVRKLAALRRERNRDAVLHGYTEERESVFDRDKVWDAWKRRVAARMQELFYRDAPFHTLSDADKVRFLYKRMLEKAVEEGYDFQENLTARECVMALNRRRDAERQIPLPYAALYAKARYADHWVCSEKEREMTLRFYDMVMGASGRI